MPQGRNKDTGDVEKEIPRTASCASASLQRGEDLPGGIERQERGRRSARPRRREETVAKMLPHASKCMGRYKQCHFYTQCGDAGNCALVSQSTVLHCTLGKRTCQRNILILPLSGCGALVLDGTKCL